MNEKKYRLQPDYTAKESKQKIEEVKDTTFYLEYLKNYQSKEIAAELEAISLGLKGKIYRESLINKSLDSLSKIKDSALNLASSRLEYLLSCFAPTPTKVWSSILSGAASSALFYKYSKISYTNPDWNYLTYTGLAVAFISYIAQSLPLTERERKILDEKNHAKNRT